MVDCFHCALPHVNRFVGTSGNVMFIHQKRTAYRYIYGENHVGSVYHTFARSGAGRCLEIAANITYFISGPTDRRSVRLSGHLNITR